MYHYSSFLYIRDCFKVCMSYLVYTCHFRSLYGVFLDQLVGIASGCMKQVGER